MVSPKALLAATLVLVCSWSASASGAKSPVEGTRALVEVVRAPSTKTQSKSLQEVRTYFDYDHLVDVPIAPHKEKLSKKELARYTSLFRELLELSPFIASLGDNKNLIYKVGKPVENKDQVQVRMTAYDKKTDSETDITFEWKKTEDGWQVIDVALDGASLVKGYQNQFGRILRKEGATGLIARLEKRLNEVKAQQGQGT